MAIILTSYNFNNFTSRKNKKQFQILVDNEEEEVTTYRNTLRSLRKEESLANK